MKKIIIIVKKIIKVIKIIMKMKNYINVKEFDDGVKKFWLYLGV